MARSFTIIQDGESRSFTIETGVGPQGPAGETGATGATGSTGATGPAGSDASVTAANVASAINGTSEKTTPVDSDVLSLLDSAASWAMKKLSWSNIKATLKLYFDTLYVAVSQLSTTGGANKVVQLDSNGVFRNVPINPNPTNPGGAWRLAAEQRLEFEDYTGTTVGNTRMIANHGDDWDSGTYPEMFWESSRHCFYWYGGFQLGNAEALRGWRYLYLNSLGIANGTSTLGGTLDGTRESIAVQFRGNIWNGSAAQPSQASIQYVPAGVKSGELGIWIGGPAGINGQMSPGGPAAYGRILASSGNTKSLGLTETGPVLPDGRTFKAAGDFTLTQNSVAVVTSVGTSAVANTLRLQNGRTRISNNANLPGTAAYPFEVAVPLTLTGANTQTTGDLYTDLNGNTFFGRVTSEPGANSGTTVWQNRLGTAQVTFNPGSATATFATTITQTQTNDATSSAGAFRTSGGGSFAKGIYLGTVLTGTEQASEPAAPAANGFVIYAVDNGSGKTKLMAKFATGAAQQLAIEP